MLTRSLAKQILANAVVQRIDVVNRELAALVEGTPVRIYAPPDCGVLLRGERIKFRLIQPGDRLRVTLTASADPLVAGSLEVLPAFPVSTLAP
jgi:hypothetical protein